MQYLVKMFGQSNTLIGFDSDGFSHCYYFPWILFKIYGTTVHTAHKEACLPANLEDFCSGQVEPPNVNYT